MKTNKNEENTIGIKHFIHILYFIKFFSKSLLFSLIHCIYLLQIYLLQLIEFKLGKSFSKIIEDSIRRTIIPFNKIVKVNKAYANKTKSAIVNIAYIIIKINWIEVWGKLKSEIFFIISTIRTNKKAHIVNAIYILLSNLSKR